MGGLLAASFPDLPTYQPRNGGRTTMSTSLCLSVGWQEGWEKWLQGGRRGRGDIPKSGDITSPPLYPPIPNLLIMKLHKIVVDRQRNREMGSGKVNKEADR